MNAVPVALAGRGGICKVSCTVESDSCVWAIVLPVSGESASASVVRSWIIIEIYCDNVLNSWQR